MHCVPLPERSPLDCIIRDSATRALLPPRRLVFELFSLARAELIKAVACMLIADTKKFLAAPFPFQFAAADVAAREPIHRRCRDGEDGRRVPAQEG
jgi:hypothetical protein